MVGQGGAILAAAGPQIYAREPTPAPLQTVSLRSSVTNGWEADLRNLRYF
jgi:hypothetical protein